MKTYGINVDIESLHQAAEDTANWPCSCGYHSVVYYDPDDGKVWTRDEGDDKTMIWDYDGICCVLQTTRHVSAQRIMDSIKQHLDSLKEIEEG